MCSCRMFAALRAVNCTLKVSLMEPVATLPLSVWLKRKLMTAVTEVWKNLPTIPFWPWKFNDHARYFGEVLLVGFLCGPEVEVNLAGFLSRPEVRFGLVGSHMDFYSHQKSIRTCSRCATVNKGRVPPDGTTTSRRLLRLPLDIHSKWLSALW